MQLILAATCHRLLAGGFFFALVACDGHPYPVKMPMPSPLFWLLLIGLAIMVWFDGVAAGRNTITNDKASEKPNTWQRAGNWLRKYVKKPTPGKVVTLFVLLLLLRLLLGLAPMLLFLLATLFWR